MSNAYDAILTHQRSWAAARRITVDRHGYTGSVDLNLFQPMGQQTRADYDRGSGNEAHGLRKRPKMCALHSSAALVCNVFDYWRDKDLGPIAEALGLSHVPDRVSFEAQFPTGLQGNPPNLDVVFTRNGLPLIAIESKFTEPYGRPKRTLPFKDKYFPSALPGLWAKIGLSGCQQLAAQLQRGDRLFQTLDAAQLLKHFLGLASHSPRYLDLLYLWYDYPGPEAARHRDEIRGFREAVLPEAGFRSLTYQELLDHLLPRVRSDAAAYAEYLVDRYLPANPLAGIP